MDRGLNVDTVPSAVFNTLRGQKVWENNLQIFKPLLPQISLYFSLAEGLKRFKDHFTKRLGPC